MVTLDKKKNKELEKELYKILNNLSKQYIKIEKKYDITLTGIHINGTPYKLKGNTYSY